MTPALEGPEVLSVDCMSSVTTAPPWTQWGLIGSIINLQVGSLRGHFPFYDPDLVIQLGCKSACKSERVNKRVHVW